MNQKEEAESELEALKTQLVSLEKELVKEEKIASEKEKEINSNPEMKKLIEKQNELKEENSVAEKQKEKLEKKIKEQFFVDEKQGYSHPYFQHKTSEWDEETNIYEDVLDEIKQHSPLYLLRNEDIGDAVTALINKAINKCLELGELIKQCNSLGERIRELWKKERSLDKELRVGFHSKTYDLRQNISKIKQEIANPKKFSEQQKRLSKRDKARNKLKDQKILDRIYKKLEIRIPKVKTNVKNKEE